MMSLHPTRLQRVLGPLVEEIWAPDGAPLPAVSCATIVRTLAQAVECRPEEAVVLDMPVGDLWDAAERVTACRAAVMLVESAVLGAGQRRRWRELAGRMPVVGLLRGGIKPEYAANAINRAARILPAAPAIALTAADSLQHLAATLGDLVGNSVTIETPQHELLAFSPMVGPVDRAREETILRRQAHPEALQWVARQGYVERVHRSTAPVRIPPNAEIGFSGRLAMRVAAEDEILAIIWVTDTQRPLTAEDEDIVQEAAGTAATILLQRREVTQREAELHTEFLEDVVQGRITQPESIRVLARSLGWAVDRRQQALVIAIDRLDTFRLEHAGRQGRLLQRARQRLTELIRLEALRVDPDAVIAPRQSGVIVLAGGAELAAAEVTRLAQSIVHRVPALIPDMTVTAGIGRVVPSLERVAETVREAELAAQLGASLWGGNRVTHANELGIYRALFALQDQEGMIVPALQSLVEHDRRHQSDYVRTLEVYFACMGRLRSAATQLAIHRNTLEYRIRRIQEVAAVDLEDPNHRLALELGIRLLRMRGDHLPV